MRFPDAYSGVKKIFVSEILTIISTASLLVGAFMALLSALGSQMDDATLALTGAGLLVVLIPAGLILALVAFILNIVGLKQGSKDEPIFSKALMFVFISIVATITNVLFTSILSLGEVGSVIAGAAETVNNISTLFITLYIVEAIRSLADIIGNEKLVRKCQNVLNLYLMIFIISVVLNILSDFVVTGVPGAILAVAALLLSMVAYILYLTLLANAKKMLKEATV